MSRYPEAPGTEEIRFVLPFATIRPNVWIRMHFSKRRKHLLEMQTAVWLALTPAWIAAHRACPIHQCEISIQRFQCGSMLDPDSLNGCAKALLDVLVVPTRSNPHGLSVITNDSADLLRLLPVEGVKCRRGQARTEVTIRVIDRRPAPLKTPEAATPVKSGKPAKPRPPANRVTVRAALQQTSTGRHRPQHLDQLLQLRPWLRVAKPEQLV